MWIALGAFALSIQTKFLLFEYLKIDLLDYFSFFATLFLYALHRLIGFYKLSACDRPLRFVYLHQSVFFFKILAGSAACLSFLLFLFLPRTVQYLTLLPIILSAGYALPFLPGKRRLRDLSYVKFLLVGLSWAWVTVVLPAAGHKVFNDKLIWIMFVARFSFITAIAITFDIRDLEIDRQQRVRTMPALVGIPATKAMALLFLVIMVSSVWLNYQLGFYTVHHVIAFCISVFFTGVLIIHAKTCYADYYYSGLLDGMILLQAILILMM